jgi:predicted transcriptional regulator
MDENDELLQFFKALSDANRLKIVGLLAGQAHTVEQLAALLQISPSTVSHHLTQLSKIGLVSARAQSYYNFYHLDTEKIEANARRLLSKESLQVAAGIDPNAEAPPVEEVVAQNYDRKVIGIYFLPDGRLKAIPSQRKKLLVILNRLVEAFKPGVEYSEKDVNEILARYHPDTASLRRELIGFRMMARATDGSRYWRIVDS